MNRIKKIIFTIMMIIIPLTIFAEGSVTLDKSSLNIIEGNTDSFTITATDASGNIDITISNSNINLTSNSSNFVKDSDIENKWHLAIDNNSVTITVEAVSEGNSNIILSANELVSSDNNPVSFNQNVSVVVNYVLSSDADLEDIKINSVPLEGFDPDITRYNIEINNSSIDLSATVKGRNASVETTVNGSSIDEGITLKYGLNIILLTVTAEDGTTTKTYTLNITRPDNRDTNSFLKSLTVSEGVLVFNKNIINYTVIIDSDITNITISAEAESENATVSGTGNKTINNDNNIFEIVVTAENETTKKYTITFVRTDQVVITYNSNGGVMCSPNSKTVERNTKMGTLCKPNRNGYTFNGWYTESSGGDKITSETIADRDFTIYAQWTKIATESPNTGIDNPIYTLIILSVLSVIIYVMIRRKKVGFD